MPGPIGERCGDCYFFDTNGFSDDGTGYCRRYPPRHSPFAALQHWFSGNPNLHEYDAEYELRYSFVLTNDDPEIGDWCGEFKPREPRWRLLRLLWRAARAARRNGRGSMTEKKYSQADLDAAVESVRIDERQTIKNEIDKHLKGFGVERPAIFDDKRLSHVSKMLVMFDTLRADATEKERERCRKACKRLQRHYDHVSISSDSEEEVYVADACAMACENIWDHIDQPSESSDHEPCDKGEP